MEEKAEKVEKAEKGKTTRVILNILIALVACVLVFCLYKLGSIWWGYHQNGVTQEKVQDLFYGRQEISGADGVGDEREYMFDLTPLILENPDTVGWIRVPDTVIDYVVVQGKDNDEYLHKNFYGEYNSAGTIFVDADNQMGEPLQNLILYGHRMRDDSMFGELGKYLDAEFFAKHPTFTFITKDGVYDCEIFSVYQCTTEVEYCRTWFSNEKQQADYVNECRQRSIYATNVEVSGQDTLITLSTCDYVLDPHNGRLVVQAKLKLKEENKNG